MERAIAKNSNNDVSAHHRNDSRQVIKMSSPVEKENNEDYIEDTIRRLDKIIQRQFKNLEKHLPRSSTVATSDKFSSTTTTNGNGTVQPSLAHDLPLALTKGVRESDDSIIITTSEKNGQRIVHVEMDVGGFSPDNIRIRTSGSVLRVSAITSEQRRDSASSHRSHFESSLNREVTLPDEVRSQNLQCWLNDAGWLVVEGPLGRDVYQPPPTKQDRRVTFQD